MKLYSYWRSSCAWRARIALGLKEQSYELVPVHLVRAGGEQKRAEYLAKNPMQQVPFLEFDSPQKLPSGAVLHGVAQSLAIIEYLDELVPSPPLLGASPLERARVRWLSEMINSGVQPLQNLFVIQELERRAPSIDVKEWCAAFIERGLRALETTLTGEAGVCLVGSQPTMADICLVPQLYNARRFGVDVDAFPRLLAAEAACEAMPAFQAARPERQPDAEL